MTITEQVAERIKTIAPDVESQVVDLLVAKETSRRVELISQGLAKLEEYQREARKLNKPDIESFDADGAPVTQAFSKARIDERKKQDEKTGKLSKALEKALGGDVGDLTNLVK